MTSLAEQLTAKVSSSRPTFHDPEDVDDVTAAQSRAPDGADDDMVTPQPASSLRKKTAALLEDEDRKYAGKSVTRKTLEEEHGYNAFASEEDEDVVRGR